MDLFDEWGNFVGKFEPSGDGCLISLAIYPALLIMFIIIMIFKIIIDAFGLGIKKCKEGKLVEGLLILGGMTSIFLLIIFGIPALDKANQHADMIREIDNKIAYNRQIEEVKNQLKATIDFNAKKGPCPIEGANLCSIGDKETYIIINVLNKSTKDKGVYVWVSDPYNTDDYKWIPANERKLLIYKRVGPYSVEEINNVCISLSFDINSGKYIEEELCQDIP
jgi:hypothetical protein